MTTGMTTGTTTNMTTHMTTNGNGVHGMKARLAAMFLAGIAADETVGHWWLGTFGRDMLPMQFGGLTVTSTLNTAMMVIWPVVLVLSLWFAVFRKGRRAATAGT